MRHTLNDSFYKKPTCILLYQDKLKHLIIDTQCIIKLHVCQRCKYTSKPSALTIFQYTGITKL